MKSAQIPAKLCSIERKTMGDGADITKLLQRVREGDRVAEDALARAVYSELRRIAGQQMKHERPNHTLQPTAVVHEAYLRVVRNGSIEWQDRAHFFNVAAQTMRRILVDYARRAKAAKRPASGIRIDFESTLLFDESRCEEVLTVEEALSRLEAVDARQCRIVELRFFAGLSVEETAKALMISPRTVKRDWNVARAWLHGQLYG
jgi:RNA polymerase sigma-70 factor (ECF subfamily)